MMNEATRVQGRPSSSVANPVSRLVTAFYEDLWNRWDDEAVNDVLAPDFTFRGSLGNQTRGRDEWRGYRDLIRAGSSDFHNEVQSLLVDQGVNGDQRVAARLLYTGTHDGTLAGMPATGRRFAYAGAAFFAIRNGQLADAWVLGDLTGLRAQLSTDN